MKTATEVNIMQDVRFNHMRNVAAKFLNETKALNLERDLTDFLVEIDKQHQEQVKDLNFKIEELLKGSIS